MEIQDRIRLLLEVKNISQSQLASDLQISKVAISKWVTQSNAFGIESVKKLLTRFPDLNARWLILGTGEMLDTKTDELKTEVSKLVAEEMKKYLPEDKRQVG